MYKHRIQILEEECMSVDSDESDEYFSAPSLSSSPCSQRAEDELSSAPTELARQNSPPIDITATRILEKTTMSSLIL